jgi:hypothetical protein
MTVRNQNRVDPQTSNSLIFEQLETRTKNYVVVICSPSLSLLGRTRSCSVSSPVTDSVSISQIQSVFKRFIYFFGLYLCYP